MKTCITTKLEHLQFPLINVRRTADFPSSTINNFAFAVGLFMISCIKANIIVKNNEKFFIAYFLFGGVCQYLYGILNWFKGHTLYSLTDFIFSLLFFSVYLKYNYHPVENDFYKMEGPFYIIWCVLFLVIIIGLKGKNILYTIIYAILLVSFIFVVIDVYINKSVITKISGYCLMVASAVIWVGGIINLITDTFRKE